MVYSIQRQLEETPEDLKTVFRVVQNAEETEDLQHGDAAALYKYSEGKNRESDLRWIKLGRYDAGKNLLASEYMLTYELDKERFGAQMKTSSTNPHDENGKLVCVPEKLYKSGLENLHELI